MYETAERIVRMTDGFPKELTYKQRVALVLWRLDKRIVIYISRITGRLNKGINDHHGDVIDKE